MGLFTAASLKSHQANRTTLEAVAAPAFQPPPVRATCDWTVDAEIENAVDRLWSRLRRGERGSGGLTQQVWAVAHWEPGEGATTIAAALALRAAQVDPVATFCLADCDFFSPRLSALTGLEAEPGLSNVVTGTASLDNALAGTRMPNLFVLPAGNPPLGRRAAEMYERCRDLWEQLALRFNYVLLDLPVLRDYPTFASWTSGLAEALLVVRAGQARQQAVAQAMRTFKIMRLEVAGLVLNAREYYVPKWLYART